MSAHTGKRLGRYRLEEVVGQGGMAEVYRARDEKLERQVAVKVILPTFASDPEFHDRFLREARLIAALEHPNILPVYDFGDDEGLSYLVMPFHDGGTLADRLDGSPLPRDQVADYVRQLAEALDAAHATGILHRDVKPANVLIGGDGRLILADFGIAKLFDGTTQLTATGAMLGTPIYMAPELARGGRATAAADLYSLACLTYQLLVGEPPFQGENALSLLHQHVNETVPSLQGRLPELPAELDSVLATGLAKDPKERPETCRRFAAALADAAGVPRTATGGIVPLPGSAVGSATEVSDTLPTHTHAVPPPTRHAVVPPRPSAARRFGIVAAGVALLLLIAFLARPRPEEGDGNGEAPIDESPPPTLDVSDAPAVTAAPASGEAPAASATAPVAQAASPASVTSPAAAPDEPADREPPPRAAARATPGGRPPPAGSAFRDRQAALAFARLAMRVERIWVDGRPERSHFERLVAEVDRLAADAVESQGLAALRLFAEGALSYCDGNRELARQKLEALAELTPRATEVLGALPVRFLRPDTEPGPWMLALAFGDPLGEGAALLAAAEAEQPGHAGTTMGRAFLAHLDGDHDEAAKRAVEVWEEIAHNVAWRREIALFVAAEQLHAGAFDEAIVWFGRVGSDARAGRRAVRSLELQGGSEAVRRACAVGYRPACAAGRRRDGG